MYEKPNAVDAARAEAAEPQVLLVHVNTGAVKLRVVWRIVAQFPQLEVVSMATTGNVVLVEYVALNVRVIVPVDPGEPVPVVMVIVPPASVPPVPIVQEGEVPPPLVNVHVGAVPTVEMWLDVEVPEMPIVG
jgi:hypothetical protein